MSNVVWLLDTGRAIAQADGLWLTTAIPSQVMSFGFGGGQSGTAVGFLRVLQFPLPSLHIH
jgi:hypothetical protein